MKIYGISGLGADERVFKYLSLNCELVSIDWIKPRKDEFLEGYALRLSETIDTKQPYVLLGVSFGGLIAAEISKQLSPELTILISSVETKQDLRYIYRLFGKTRIVNFLPKKVFDIPRKIAKPVFGTEQTDLLNQILDDTDLSFTKWAVQRLLTWQNTTRLDNCLIISGANDKLLLPFKSQNVKLIEGGGHFMIVDRAKEISNLINEELSRKQLCI